MKIRSQWSGNKSRIQALEFKQIHVENIVALKVHGIMKYIYLQIQEKSLKILHPCLLMT